MAHWACVTGRGASHCQACRIRDTSGKGPQITTSFSTREAHQQAQVPAALLPSVEPWRKPLSSRPLTSHPLPLASVPGPCPLPSSGSLKSSSAVPTQFISYTFVCQLLREILGCLSPLRSPDMLSSEWVCLSRSRPPCTIAKSMSCTRWLDANQPSCWNWSLNTDSSHPFPAGPISVGH